MTDVFNRIADDLAEFGFSVSNQFLSQQEVQSIVALEHFQNALTEFKQAGIGKNNNLQVNEAVRGDYIRWIDKTTAPEPLQLYTARLDDLRKHLNESLFLSLKDIEVHMTVYPAGAFYKRHLDQFKQDDHRKLSVICYLNKGWASSHGGELRMYLENGPQDFLPIAGKLICFRSDQIEHEVRPATRERLSLTGWMLDQISDLRHL
jgi:SM-20-related protein